MAKKEYKLVSGPQKIFDSMLNDISRAKKSICIETYRYNDDAIGIKFKEMLVKKAKKGVKVKLLLDSWGSGADKDFFEELLNAGGEVKFFAEIIISLNFFNKNHKRDHRKIMIIDDKISYIGSNNIAAKCLTWREMVLRINSPVSILLKEAFEDNWRRKREILPLIKRQGELIWNEFEVLMDVPSNIYSPTKKKYLELIRNAKKEIRIETPYFLPPRKIVQELEKAAKRGVKVTLAVPYDSDIRIIDILRDTDLAYLHRGGVHIFMYKPGLLHTKMMVVDEDKFIIGSTNLDYRSFLYQFEINLYGINEDIANLLYSYSDKTLKQCEEFNYASWHNRPLMLKLVERIIRLIKYLL
jgi:cardiolipin synthase